MSTSDATNGLPFLVSLAKILPKLCGDPDPLTDPITSVLATSVPLFTAIFALARTTGWIAQLNEMISDPEYKIGRPRQLFTGSAHRDVKPIDQR